MHKFFFTLFGILGIIGSTHISAENYPDSLNNNAPFTSFSDFENLYETVYQDTQTLELIAIKERLCEYPVFDCEKTLVIESFSDLLGQITLKTEVSQLSENRFRDYLRTRLEYERQLLHLERSLARANGLTLIYTDGDGGQKNENDTRYLKKNSPFDINEVLNRFDKLWFGKKSTPFAPTFLQKNPETPDFSKSADAWTDQREEKLNPDANFSDDDSSLTGTFFNVAKIFAEDINPVSLLCTKNTKNIFDYPFCTTPTGVPKISAEFWTPPVATSDDPEHETIQAIDLSEFFTQGQLTNFLNQADCETEDISQERQRGTNLLTGLKEIDFCAMQQNQMLGQNQQQFSRELIQNQIESEYRGFSSALNNWAGWFDFFYETLNTKFKPRWESINNHSQG